MLKFFGPRYCPNAEFEESSLAPFSFSNPWVEFGVDVVNRNWGGFATFVTVKRHFELRCIVFLSEMRIQVNWERC